MVNLVFTWLLQNYCPYTITFSHQNFNVWYQHNHICSQVTFLKIFLINQQLGTVSIFWICGKPAIYIDFIYCRHFFADRFAVSRGRRCSSTFHIFLILKKVLEAIKLHRKDIYHYRGQRFRSWNISVVSKEKLKSLQC